MKKNPILTFALAMLFTLMAKAQYHEVKINGLGLLYGQYSLGYEYCINNDMGVGLTLTYFDWGSDFLDFSTVGSNSGFLATADYRYYLDYTEGADDFFVGGYARFRNQNSVADVLDLSSGNTLSLQPTTINALALGFTFGQKYVGRSGFVFEYFVGAGRNVSITSTLKDEGENTTIIVDYFDTDWDLRLGGVLGYRF